MHIRVADKWVGSGCRSGVDVVCQLTGHGVALTKEQHDAPAASK